MHLQKNVFAVSALAAALSLVAPVAEAGSHYCDNDRNPSQYPKCSNPNATGWSYGYWSGDKHGDDRRNRSSNSPGGEWGYTWKFTERRSYRYYAWLANPYFTDSKASYTVFDLPTRTTRSIKFINQNTAPSGWSFVGSGLSTWITVFPNSQGNTGVAGADMIRADFSGASASMQALGDLELQRASKCPALATGDPRITAIQDKMLNAMDYYDDALGSFDVYFSNSQQKDKVDFEASQRNRSSFVRVTAEESGKTVEFVTKDTVALLMDSGNRSYQQMILPAEEPAAGPRFFRNADCDAMYVLRDDPANAIGADDVLAPQNYAFWLNNSKSRIVGRERLLDRHTTVIQGRHDDYLANKLGAQTYRMWVDEDTGVLLKLIGTNAAGKLAYSINVRDIRFDSGLEPIGELKAPAGWKRVDAAMPEAAAAVAP